MIETSPILMGRGWPPRGPKARSPAGDAASIRGAKTVLLQQIAERLKATKAPPPAKPKP